MQHETFINLNILRNRETGVSNQAQETDGPGFVKSGISIFTTFSYATNKIMDGLLRKLILQ